MNQSLPIRMRLTSLVYNNICVCMCVCVVDEDGAGRNEG